MTPFRTYLTTLIPTAHRDPARLTPQARQIRSLLLDEALAALRRDSATNCARNSPSTRR